jgi:hypothetical protein
MATKQAWVAGTAMVAAILAADQVAAKQESGLAHAGKPIVADADRVRSNDTELSALIREAADRSPAFRHLKERIQVSDGLVYIVRGRCGHYVRACLAFWVGVAPPNRLLRVVVDYDKADEEAMATIAHELSHALEVLDEPSVRSGDDMFFFYRRNRSWQGGAFETQEAVDAGNTVRRELRKQRTREKPTVLELSQNLWR